MSEDAGCRVSPWPKRRPLCAPRRGNKVATVADRRRAASVPTIIVQESDLGGFWEILAEVLDWCIWAVFAVNLAIMLSMVPNRRRWLTENPLDVLIVVFTPPFLPATMKLARVLPVVRLLWLMAIAHRLRNVFSLQGCATRR